MGHYVYKYIYNDEIIYIGKNDTDLISRINQHKLETKFQPYLLSDVYYIKLDNEYDTDIMETLLINKYKPLLNVAKKNKYKLNIDFTEPEWKKYCENDFKTKHKKEYSKLGDVERKNAIAKLDNMLKILANYQYIHNYNFNIEKDNLYFVIPKQDLENFPMIFEIPLNKGWKIYNLWDSIEEDDKGSVFFLNEKHYRIFQNNYDLIINTYKNKIIEFANKKDLELYNEFNQI